mgnify:CR=1 FL=1
MTDIRRTTCPYDCPASCGLLATIENGRVAGCRGSGASGLKKDCL